ncbi:unnamed protein product [Urochloa humidicola]
MACEPAGPASALSIRWPWQCVATREQAWAHGGGDDAKAAERELKRFFLDSVNWSLENPSRNWPAYPCVLQQLLWTGIECSHGSIVHACFVTTMQLAAVLHWI